MQAKFYLSKHKTGKILAFADVDLDGGITVKGFRIVDGENGLFAGVPSRPVKVDGKTHYLNQVTFETDEIRERFLAKLLDDYHAWNQQKSQATPA